MDCANVPVLCLACLRFRPVGATQQHRTQETEAGCGRPWYRCIALFKVSRNTGSCLVTVHH
jgi:hypothetical protein